MILTKKDNRKDRVRLDNLKQVKAFYKRLINDYYNDKNISSDKFKNLIYGLNSFVKLFETAELEQKIDGIIAELEQRNKNINADEFSSFDIDSIINN